MRQMLRNGSYWPDFQFVICQDTLMKLDGNTFCFQFQQLSGNGIGVKDCPPKVARYLPIRPGIDRSLLRRCSKPIRLRPSRRVRN